ncbi:MAG TPA: hypothetical protein PK530_14300 [Anaerolineales bacterium]|nr:hypothetical protein [Anaerolineales bacterium]
MKYTLESECAPCGFEEFAQKHGLELVVKERVMDDWTKRMKIERYFAQFRDVHESFAGGSGSCYENGNTPEEAIKMFQQKLLGKRLVYNPGGDCEPRYFVAPNAWQ